MSKYKYLLWDLDGTILNFELAEKNAIRTLFEKYELGLCSDQMLQDYSVINRGYWEALERNEMKKQDILVARFRDFFAKYDLPVELAYEFNLDYQLALGDTIVYCDNAREIIEKLKENYILSAITNGTKEAQEKKLRLSGLDQIFDYIFISEIVGSEKPNKSFFDAVIGAMRLQNMDEVLVIGDSLTSDIKGGNNAGIDTCWYNPKGLKNTTDIVPIYEIGNINQLLEIVLNA